MTEILRLVPDELPAAVSDLAEILLACVHDGASVGFVLPFARVDALTFWRDRVFPFIRADSTTLFAARDNGHIIGTVQLVHGLMPNQTHRADVVKMLVHPENRRSGVGRALLQALETHARSIGKSLLVLDTRSGDAAQFLYLGLGFQVAGEIPGYCRHPFSDTREATTYMYKTLT